MTRIDLAWDASTDDTAVTGYKVYRGGVEIATVTGTSYSNTGLTPNTTYSYTVAAFDAVPNTSAQSSPPASAATLPDTAAPSVPLGLAGTAVSPTQINLTWSASTDNVAVTSYDLYRNGNATPIATVTGTSYSNTGLTANITYSYTVRASDAAGNHSAQSSPAISVTTPPVSTAITWEARVSASGNDAEEFIGGTATDLSSTDLELVTDGTTLQLVGMRFVNLTIPKNATITNAYIQFTTDEVSTAATTVSIAAEAVDNSAIFTTADNNISARALAGVTASWNPAAWNTIDEAGANQRTTNLASVVQQIVNRANWNSGNALSFIVSGSGKRVASSFNISSGTKAPLLHVEYSSP